MSADTKRSIYEIENIIAKSRDFNYVKNIIAYNVIGQSETLRIGHECDVLVCSKAGYLSEIEIKRSWEDFLNDFEKDHDHSSKLIKNLYYCVPAKLKDKVIEYISNRRQSTPEGDFRCNAGVMVYNEDNDWLDVVTMPRSNWNAKKLFIEQKMELARLEAMRVVKFKDKLIKYMKEDIKPVINWD